MAVDEDLTAYSTLAAGNTPGGLDNIGTDLDDHLRDIKKNMAWLVSSSRGNSAPGNIRGRLWFDSSATSSSTQVLKLANGGTKWGTIATINTVTGETFCPANPNDFASTGTVLTAGSGLSGGGTLATNRSFSLANTGLTATTTATLATVVVDPFGRVVGVSSGPTVATAAQMEDRSTTASYVTPVHMKDHLGVAKAWAVFDGSGTASLGASYNIASVVRSAVGTYTINFSTGFTSNRYAVTGSAGGAEGGLVKNFLAPSGANPRIDSCPVQVVDQNATLVDADFISVTFFGFHTT